MSIGYSNDLNVESVLCAILELFREEADIA